MIKRTKGRNNATFKQSDFYKEYSNSIENPLSSKQYSDVRKELYLAIVQEIYEEGDFIFPHRFGKVSILKRKRKIVYNADGSINKINYKVDWKATKEYWSEKYPDMTPEQLKDIKGKPKIYCNSEWRYYFYYNKSSALYKNKNFTWMLINRHAARGLKNYLDDNPHRDFKEK